MLLEKSHGNYSFPHTCDSTPTMILHCRQSMARRSVRHSAEPAGRYMVAIMNEALELRNGMRVLEVGAGSGYHAATIAEIVGDEGHVFAIEYLDKLVSIARTNLKRAGYTNRVTLVQGDGSQGYAERAPYDRILVTAAAPKIPPPLVQQLKQDGIIVLPVGGRMFPQELVRVRKKPSGALDRISLGGVAFVPLIGKYGFND